MAAGGGGASFQFPQRLLVIILSETEPGRDHVTLHHMRGGGGGSFRL